MNEETCDTYSTEPNYPELSYDGPKVVRKSAHNLMERDQEIRTQAIKIWLNHLLEVGRHTGIHAIPSLEDMAKPIELLGNYMLNGDMEINDKSNA